MDRSASVYKDAHPSSVSVISLKTAIAKYDIPPHICFILIGFYQCVKALHAVKELHFMRCLKYVTSSGFTVI